MIQLLFNSRVNMNGYDPIANYIFALLVNRIEEHNSKNENITVIDFNAFYIIFNFQ